MKIPHDAILFFEALLVIFHIAFAPIRVFAGSMPNDYGLHTGQTVRLGQHIDVMVIGEHGYRRLMINPEVFTMYQHHDWSAVQSVPGNTMGAFPQADLVRNCMAGDPRVYALEITGEDSMLKHWVRMTSNQVLAKDPDFYNKVFCANSRELAYYPRGNDYTSLDMLPQNARGVPYAGSVNANFPASETTGPVSSGSPLAGSLISSSLLHNGLTYTEAINAYRDSLMQFNVMCQAVSNRQVLKTGQHIMLDNRSSSPRIVTFGTQTIQLAAWDFAIVSAPIVTEPYRLSVDCDQENNAAEILVLP